MLKLHLWTLMAAAAFLVGCASSSSDDPLKSFESKIDAGKQEASIVRLNSPDGRWQKVRFEILDTEYDVQKSDSLSTPFTAKLDLVAMPHWSPLVDDKAAASAIADGDLMQSDLKDRYKFEYVFQGEKWVLKSANYSTFGGGFKEIGAPSSTAGLVKGFFD